MRHKPNPATQCQHRTKDRKQCQMSATPVAQTSACPRQGVCVPLTSADSPTTSNSAHLCPHHQRTAANQIYQSIEPTRRRPEKDPAQIEALAAALLTNTNNLSDPAQVNQFLANLLNQLAHKKISRKNAIAMAYISQLLLNSISVKHKQDRDAQAAQQAAQANKPTQIIIDVDRPNYGSSDLRSGDSFYPEPRRADSHSVDVPTVPAIPNHATTNPPPPTDDPPLPRTHNTLHSRAGANNISPTAATANLRDPTNSDHRGWAQRTADRKQHGISAIYVTRPDASAFSLHLSCFA